MANKLNNPEILIVEDDPFLLELYSKKFSESGFEVKVCTGGQDAIKQLRKSIPAMMLLDLVLPDLDGLEVLKIMQQDKELSSVPVIVLTNRFDITSETKARQFNIVDYLVKMKYTPTELVAKVKSWLENNKKS